VDLWVFAYGSLMWRPGFEYEEHARALLEGAHRSLCLYSVIYRGVPKAPGLVLGLDKGGRCEGVAFRVPSALATSTRAYLHRRENLLHAYNAITKTVKLLDGSHRTASALCFEVRRENPQYAGDLPLVKQVQIVRRSGGKMGPNIDYVVNTVEHLRALGVHDARLERLMAALGHSPVRAKYVSWQG
jgi:glutathione-specific gamma-glutamylcyclotransferase